MRCSGEVVYKGVDTRSAGTFTNAQGQSINYKSSYVLTIDDISNNKVHEVKLKFPVSDTRLYDDFMSLDLYTKIKLDCDVELTQRSCKLVPKSFEIV